MQLCWLTLQERSEESSTLGDSTLAAQDQKSPLFHLANLLASAVLLQLVILEVRVFILAPLD